MSFQIPFIGEFRLKQAAQPLTTAWMRMPVEPRRSTLLGISFRTPQVDALGLDARASLQTLLAYPFQIIRLGAYWNRIETAPRIFNTDELDWQIDSAEQAGKQIIVCVGPVKTFSYPEFFVPTHHLQRPLPEHTRVTPSTHPSLLTSGLEFLTHLVKRYQHRQGIIAWQLEHEPVDPLGMEHSWRLDAKYVTKELESLRMADPTRPVIMNGFLPTSLLVLLSQWWQTRDQGDSLAVAQRMADIVGIDYYPRHALLQLGRRTVYLDGSASLWQQRGQKRLFAWTQEHAKQLMVTEGQSEPWEAMTFPYSPHQHALFSCLPEHLIANYNTWMRWSLPSAPLFAYLFWGAEYWLLRKQGSDSSYLQAFIRILENA